MSCPRCGKPMVRFTNNGVREDFCRTKRCLRMMSANYDPYCPDCKIGSACGLSSSQHRRVRKAKKRAEKQATEVRTQELVAAEYPGARITQLYKRASGEIPQKR